MSLFTQHLLTQNCMCADPSSLPSLTIVALLRQWLDRFEIGNTRTAHLICKLIPSTCPFEQHVFLFGCTFHIPAVCKLNPLYNELVALRFRALSYLSNVGGENITQYIV